LRVTPRVLKVNLKKYLKKGVEMTEKNYFDESLGDEVDAENKK
jgi:hypothetical protein